MIVPAPASADQVLSDQGGAIAAPLVSSDAMKDEDRLLFDPARLSVRASFGARPSRRAYSGNLEAYYSVTDEIQLGAIAPAAFSGFKNPDDPAAAPRWRLTTDNFTLRSTYTKLITDDGSFAGVSVDLAFGQPSIPAEHFKKRNAIVVVSPYIGLHYDAYDLLLSASVSSDIRRGVVSPLVSPNVRLTRKVADDLSLGVEYSSGVGRFGQFTAFRNQAQTVYGVGVYDYAGFRFDLGVGLGVTRASRGLAMRFSVGHSFR